MTVKIDGTNTVANPAFTGADTDTGLQCGTNEVKLVTGGTARATVDSSGHLLVGDSTSIRSGSIEVIQSFADAEINVTESSDAGSGPKLRLTRTRGSNVSSPSAVDSGNFMGSILFDSYDSTNYRIGAQIQAIAGANWSSGSCATDLYFATTPSGSHSPSERMRILSSGGLTFNGDTAQTNALDDYEEGGWSAVLRYHTDNTNTSTTNGTISPASATYTKIGRLVYVTCKFTTSSTGNYVYKEITGLPFPASKDAALKVRIRGGVYRYSTSASSSFLVSGMIGSGGSTISLNTERTDLTSSGWLQVRTGNQTLLVTGCYHTAA